MMARLGAVVIIFFSVVAAFVDTIWFGFPAESLRAFLSDYLVLGGPVTQEACPRRCMKQTRPGISPTAISFLHVFLFASDEILFDFSRYDEHVMDEGKVYKVDIKLIFRIYAYYIVIKLLSSSSFQLLPM